MELAQNDKVEWERLDVGLSKARWYRKTDHRTVCRPVSREECSESHQCPLTAKEPFLRNSKLSMTTPSMV